MKYTEEEWIADMKSTGGSLKAVTKSGKYEQIITVSINKALNGIELSFRYKPSECDRAAMKRDGWKYHYKKMIWYAVNTPEHAATIGKLHGTIKYPEGWKPATRADNTLADFIKNNATAILTEAVNNNPDFMTLTEEEQNAIFMEEAEAMINTPAVA